MYSILLNAFPTFFEYDILSLVCLTGLRDQSFVTVNICL